MKAAAKAAELSEDEPQDVSAADGGSSEDEFETNERDDETEEEEEGMQDPAAKPLAPVVLKAPSAKQKPGKVLVMQV